MKYSIGQTISRAIKENKWLSIDYVNKDKQESSFWCSILDITPNKILTVDIFNIFKGNKVINSHLYFDNIKRAKILDGTYYSYDKFLIDKIEKNINELSWLEFDNFNDKILEYYSQAKRLDVDPYQSDYSNVSGIDVNYLLKNKKVILNDEQFEKIAKDIYKNEDIEKTNKISELAINKLAIYDNSGHEYIVAYYPLNLNVKAKSLIINNDLIVNKSFLIMDNKVSLASYLTINPDDYVKLLHSNFEEARELLRDNLRSVEKIDENPLIMLISRNINLDFDTIYQGIVDKHKNGTLELPMKAFLVNFQLEIKVKVSLILS